LCLTVQKKTGRVNLGSFVDALYESSRSGQIDLIQFSETYFLKGVESRAIARPSAGDSSCVWGLPNLFFFLNTFSRTYLSKIALAQSRLNIPGGQFITKRLAISLLKV
jgi:hypothetical protein